MGYVWAHFGTTKSNDLITGLASNPWGEAIMPKWLKTRNTSCLNNGRVECALGEYHVICVGQRKLMLNDFGPKPVKLPKHGPGGSCEHVWAEGREVGEVVSKIIILCIFGAGPGNC